MIDTDYLELEPCPAAFDWTTRLLLGEEMPKPDPKVCPGREVLLLSARDKDLNQIRPKQELTELGPMEPILCTSEAGAMCGVTAFIFSRRAKTLGFSPYGWEGKGKNKVTYWSEEQVRAVDNWVQRHG